MHHNRAVYFCSIAYHDLICKVTLQDKSELSSDEDVTVISSLDNVANIAIDARAQQADTEVKVLVIV